MNAETEVHDERAARNEALFRRVNERVEEVNRGVRVDPRDADFFCECAEVECMEKIRMTLPEYESVRAVSTHFAVKPGHEFPEAERVVEERRRLPRRREAAAPASGPPSSTRAIPTTSAPLTPLPVASRP